MTNMFSVASTMDDPTPSGTISRSSATSVPLPRATKNSPAPYFESCLKGVSLKGGSPTEQESLKVIGPGIRRFTPSPSAQNLSPVKELGPRNAEFVRKFVTSSSPRPNPTPRSAAPRPRTPAKTTCPNPTPPNSTCLIEGERGQPARIQRTARRCRAEMAVGGWPAGVIRLDQPSATASRVPCRSLWTAVAK